MVNFDRNKILQIKEKSMESKECLVQARNKMSDAYLNFKKYYKQEGNEELARYKKMCEDKIEELNSMINQINSTINECDEVLLRQ